MGTDAAMSAEPAGWAPLGSDTSGPRSEPGRLRRRAPRHLRLRRSLNPVLAALDGGGDVFQRRARDVLLGGAILIAPMFVLNLWATVLAFDRLDTGSAVPWLGDDATTGIEEVVALIALVLASFTAALVGVFAALLLIGDRFGRPVGLGSALSTTLRRLPAVVVGWGLGHFWVPLVPAYVVGAGTDEDAIGRLLLALPVAGVLSTFTVHVSPVMIAEETGPIGALKRSWRLSRLRFGAGFGFVTAATFLGGLLLVGIALLPAALETTGFVTFGEYTWLANGIAGQLGVIVVVPLVALATAQLYLEVRLDAEAMDLALDADDVFPDREPTP